MLMFGRYAGPIDKLPGTYQRGYAELFRQAQPIDFGRLSLEAI
jgi:hypothetical protein